MICPEVGRYLENTKGLPFLYAIGDIAYVDILTELKQVGLKVIRVSDFCSKEDRFPDYDSLIEHFRTLDIDYKDNRFVVVGLGESLALKGTEEAKKVLRRIKSVTLGNARVVVLLRGVTSCLKDIFAEDPRLLAKGLGYIEDDCSVNILITNNRVVKNLKCVGIKGVVSELENGATGNVNTTSMLSASAHKFNGPKGIGFLYSTGGIPNLIDGGAQEKGHRAGTENVAAIVGMAVALEKNCMEMKANTEKILGLEQLLVNRLDTSGLDYIRNGVNQLPGNISLSFANAEGEMILHRMDLKKICISTGSACDSVNTQVSHVIKAIGVPEKYAKGTIRISFGKNNSEEEVLTIADTLIKILKV